MGPAGRGGPRLSTEAGGGEGGSIWSPVQRVKLTLQKSLWVMWGGDRRRRVTQEQKTTLLLTRISPRKAEMTNRNEGMSE